MADGGSVSDMLSGEALLQLDPLGDDRFRGRHNQDNHTGTIFGGQPFGQALAAAGSTVADWPAQSCGGQYFRPGALDKPVDYDVLRISDSRRFATRRVIARQGDRRIAEFTCTFHDPEDGLEHRMPDLVDAPAPEDLSNMDDYVRAHAARLPAQFVAFLGKVFPVEIRPVDIEAMLFEPGGPADHSFWFRIRSPGRLDRPRDHQYLLALMSDYWMASTGRSSHGGLGSPRRIVMSTLSHNLWFHGPVDARQWLLYRTESPWAGDGRALVRGFIHDRGGRMIASAVQEASMRPQPEEAA